jgi:dihydroflavonol-4-reductase
MKPVLVTGASGFLGWHVARVAIEHGCAVRALVRPGSRVEELPVETVTGDLRDPASLERAVAGCGIVFHVAGDYRLWSRHPRELYDNNVEGTRHLLEAARAAGVERVVHTSTVGAIGLVAGGLGDEDTPVTLADMDGDYKRSKFLAERVALEFARDGMDIVIANPTAPMGDHDFKPTPTGQIIASFLDGAMPAYIDTGLNVVDARDAAEGHWLACQRGRRGQRYILGSENLTLEEILRQLAAITHRNPPRVRLPYFLAWCAGASGNLWARLTGTPPRISLESVRLARKKMWVSHAKAARELGYQPGPAAQALERAVAWFTRRREQA